MSFDSDTAQSPLLPRLRRLSSVGIKNELGVFNGVYVPCLLNILGVILFMRLSWAVGQAGWANVLIMFLVGETAALLTVLSMSALISTGNIRGGGSYYLLSRSLGPEIGGAIGIVFYLAYAIATTFNVVGFATEVIDTVYPGMEPHSQRKMYITALASIALWFITLVSYVGAGFFSKINSFVFLLQASAVLLGIISIFFVYDAENSDTIPSTLTNVTITKSLGFVDLMQENMWADYGQDAKCANSHTLFTDLCDFRIVYGILFNAVTGIMEGANLSGDLADPRRAIPKGTLWAVASACSLYLVLVIAFAGTFQRQTLKANANLMQTITWPSEYVTVFGICIAAFSAGLGSLFGGARILQALGRDNLPPDLGLHFFAKGSKHGDEPRRAVLFTFLIAQLCTFIGDLDLISPIIASCFLFTYACVNLTCLLLDISGTPNFRPSFRFYSRNQSLAGFVLCIGIVIYLNAYYSLCALILIIVCVVYISLKNVNKDWGAVSQALMYQQARKFILRLDETNHPKHWRPAIVLLQPSFQGELREGGKKTLRSFGTFSTEFLSADIEDKADNLKTRISKKHGFLRFINDMKKGGLFIVGQVVKTEFNFDSDKSLLSRKIELINYVRDLWSDSFPKSKIKAIVEVVLTESNDKGFFDLLNLAGLGGMKPNTVLIELPATSYDYSISNLFSNTIVLQKNFLVAANFANQEAVTIARSKLSLLSVSILPTKMHYLDVVIFGDQLELKGTMSLQIQMAHILTQKQKRLKIRLLNVIDLSVTGITEEDQRVKLNALLAEARIAPSAATVNILKCEQIPDLNEETATPFNHLLKNFYNHYSEAPKYVFIPVSKSVGESSESTLHATLSNAAAELPAVLYCCAGQLTNVITQDL